MAEVSANGDEEDEYEEVEVEEEIEVEEEVEVTDSSSEENAEGDRRDTATEERKDIEEKKKNSAETTENNIVNGDAKRSADDNASTRPKQTDASDIFGSSSDDDEEDEVKSKAKGKFSKNYGEAEFDADDDIELGGAYRSSGIIETFTQEEPKSAFIHACDTNRQIVFKKECFNDSKYSDLRASEEQKKCAVDIDMIVRWMIDDSSEERSGDAEEAGVKKKIKSNARIVEWSDGSRMLQVGKNFFKMVDRKSGKDDSDFVYAYYDCYAEESKSRTENADYDMLKNHGKVLSKQRLIGLKSKSKKRHLFTKSHERRAAKLIVADRDALRLRQEKLKDLIEKERSQRDGTSRRSRTQRNVPAVSYEEDELSDSALDAGETESLSIGALKKQSKKRQRPSTGGNTFDAESDEDEEEDEYQDSPVRSAPKRPRPESNATHSEATKTNESSVAEEPVAESAKQAEVDQDANFEIEEDDEEDITGGLAASKQPKRARRAVVSDDEDED